MFQVTYPGWVNVLLIVAAAALAYTSTQLPTLRLPDTTVFVIGLAQVVVTTLAALQKQVTGGVQRLRSRRP